MSGLVYSILLQCKLDMRNKHVLSAYYVMPIVFFLIIGAVFHKIDPLAKDTLVQNMSILAISIAAFLGTPSPLVEFFASDCKKTYRVGNIKLYVFLLTSFLSAVAHMLIVSTFIYITAPFIFDVNRPEQVGAYFAWLLLFIVLCTIIGMVIGLISKTNSMMTMVSQLIFLPTMLISGIMFPTTMLPEVLQKMGAILPATYAVEVLTSLNKVTVNMVYPLLLIGVVASVLLITQYRKIQVD
ncbi:MAG: ABC transporter permease [Bacilli bacterium]